MRFVIALLLWPMLCAAQWPAMPFYAGGAVPLTACQLAIGNGYPTNISGYPAYAWWVANCGYSTNAGLATLKDLSVNGLNLADASSASPNQAQSLNGLSALHFSNTGHLTNNQFTIPTSSQSEFFMVMAITNGGGQGYFFGNDANGEFVFDTPDFSTLSMYAGSPVTVSKIITNKWAVFDVVWNGASSTIYTNNIQGASGNVGTLGLTDGKFRVPPTQSACEFALAELIVFRTNLTSALRSNVFFTLTNKYASASSPFQ